MPLYEGIGLVSDKNPIVVDIGAAYTKCGFAGESGPRFVIPSEVCEWSSHEKCRVVDYNRPAADQRRLLVDFLHLIYYKYLLVNPKERRVVVVESVLSPTAYRTTLAQVLFQHFEVPSVIFAPSHLMACFPLGCQHGLVVDVGYDECVVLPVFEGVPLLSCIEAAPIAAKAVHSNLRRLLLQKCKLSAAAGRPQALSECPDMLTEALLEDIKVRTCFVSTRERGLLYQQLDCSQAAAQPALLPPPSVDYPLQGDKTLHIDGSVREAAMELLFAPDEDGRCLPTLVLDSVLRLPIDLRKCLLERLLLTGGSTMMPGFVARLQSELLHLLRHHSRYQVKLPLKQVKFFQPPCRPNYTCWLGGAIFGALEILPHRSVSRESFAERPLLPDWPTFDGNSPEQPNGDAPLR